MKRIITFKVEDLNNNYRTVVNGLENFNPLEILGTLELIKNEIFSEKRNITAKQWKEFQNKEKK
jgi:hypothetical protein